MATPLDLLAADKLFKLDPALEANEQEWRTIYVLPRAMPRFQTDLPKWQSNWKVEVSPIQQLDALAEVFCSGDTLTYGLQFKPLTHIKDGIWELKTPDLRLFGWFWIKDCFLCGALDLAFNVKNHDLYRGYATQVAFDRALLDLDEPKFVPGDQPDEVVSSYNYP